ncbi:MAG: DUF952 domain-containing protein [Actinomycetota bacterium]|nr:DUF952 domain-containing protein [Actinomycetota bacterium]
MLFHICTAEEWQRARIAGVYVAAALSQDGFVHCSDPGTVHLPANQLYAGRRDLVLLQIDPARLAVPVKWEPGVVEDPAGPWFPHIYGEIHLDAVVAVLAFVPNGGGGFAPVQPDLAPPAAR